MRLPVRLFFICLFLVFSFLLLKPNAFAQTVSTPTQAPKLYLAPDTNSDVPQNLHTFSQSVVIELLSSLSCQLSGRDPLNKQGLCLGLDPKTGKLGYVNTSGGALGAMTGMIAVLYTPPLHTSDFIAYMQQNFGLAKTSYAAPLTGIGFEGLTPLLKAWTVFRNVVYLLFVFIFVLIGLAIMLRVRIDPRTVMTIQNQIPKIIVSLVLVTFSFAIAGFLIDIMWVSIYVIINLMHQADPKIVATTVNAAVYHPAPQFANDVLPNGKEAWANLNLGGIHGIAVNGASGIAQIIRDFIRPDSLPPAVSGGGSESGGGGCSWGPFCIISNPIGTIASGNLNPVDIIGSSVSGALGSVGDLIGGIISSVISWVVGIVAYLILIIALLWALLRLWFALLKAYVSILIDVIFAPFWIIAGLIPGQTSAGFGGWLRDLAGNLAAFPAAIMMFLLATLMSDNFIKGAGSGSTMSYTAFVPPLLGTNAENYIASLIAIGIVLATPGVVDMTKKAFKAPQISLGGITQAIGVGAQAPKTVIGGGLSAAFNPFGTDKQKERAGSTLGSVLRGFGVTH